MCSVLLPANYFKSVILKLISNRKLAYFGSQRLELHRIYAYLMHMFEHLKINRDAQIGFHFNKTQCSHR